MRVSVFAPAKVNLSLHVARPRADGRHPLVSVVAFADVGDVLTIEPGETALTLSGPFAAALDGENLILRALAMIGFSARVHLEKNLPVASGIGGGSADAAAALRGANALRKRPLSEPELMAKAAMLGADIPACILCQPAVMRGAGEILAPLAMPALDAVLVNPGVGVATAAVYRRFDEMGLGADVEGDQPPPWRDSGAAIAALKGMRNDLEAPARALEPAIGDVLERLARPEVLLGRMSGSGATCFALMSDRTGAETLAAALSAERFPWWVRAVRIGAVDAAPQAG
jgi:4-diphosphocytidyl-2-C-methyl-D-erythritol kinase